MIKSAQEYHRQTSYKRYELGQGGLDFGNQPEVFKTYPGLQTVGLPQVLAWPQDKLSEIIRESPGSEARSEMDLDRLAQIILLTHSLTAKARYGGVEFYYRSVASAGALYPFELYVGSRYVSGLQPGLYHHSVGIHALTRLRSGTIIPALAESVRTERDAAPALAFFLTSIFFRSSWKYRDRGYRYNLLDTGHLAENLCLALRALRLPFELHYDFDDRRINSLLGVDGRSETCLAVCCVWGKRTDDLPDPPSLTDPPAGLRDASRVSVREKTYPLIAEVHKLTSRLAHSSKGPVKMDDGLGLKTEQWEKMPRVDQWPEKMNYSESVFKRRSSRNFVRDQLPARELVALLELLCSTRDGGKDGRLIAKGALSVGFLAGSVEDLQPGFYMLDLETESFSLVFPGNVIEKMAHTCLDQSWLSNCAVHFLFMSNLQVLEETWGPRGYRYAMLTAGRLGQRIYVGATSMKVGCCGVGAFYDGEVAQLLGLNDQTSLFYLVAAGPLKKWIGART